MYIYKLQVLENMEVKFCAKWCWNTKMYSMMGDAMEWKETQHILGLLLLQQEFDRVVLKQSGAL